MTAPKASTVKAPCPDCGSVTIPCAELRVRVCEGQYAYSFPCSKCGRRTARGISPAIAEMLEREAGIVAIEVTPPDEPRPGGPRLTADDLLDFAIALNRTPDLLEELNR